MRRSRERAAPAIALLATAVLCALACTSSGAARPAHRCPPLQAGLIRVNAIAALYGGDARVEGCVRPSGRSHELYTDDGEYTFGSKVRLGGRFGAYSLVEFNPCDKYAACPPGTPGSTRSVGIVDLRSGTRRTAPAQVSVAVLIVSSRGIAAWTDSGNDGVTRVVTLGPGGMRLLDTDTTIDAKSLVLHGTTLTWAKSGESQTAALTSR
jgi:hypothetical protein